MKKLFISVFLSLLLVVFIGGTVFADPLVEVDVDVSEIEVAGTGQVGTTVIVSGEVVITATAESGIPFLPDYAVAESNVGYTIIGPGVDIHDGQVITDSDYSKWYWLFDSAEASASNVFTLSQSFYISYVGVYTIDLFADAFAESWATFFGYKVCYISDDDEDSATLSFMGWMPPTWYDNGQFELVITDFNTSHRGYELLDNVLVPDVIQYGYASDRIIRVDIPSGTIATDENGDPVTKVLVRYYNGYGFDPYFEIINGDKPGPQNGTEIHFSNPVVISQTLGGGELMELVTFTEVIDGVLYQLISI